MLDFLAGATVATVCITIGHILHMRYLDRKLVPPQPRPLPAPRPLRPQQGGPHDLI